MNLRYIGTSIALFACAIGYAATPEEEARFLAALTDALKTKNQEELVALSCWDRVPEDIKKITIDGMGHVMKESIKSVQFQDVDDSRATTRQLNGVTYAPNIPITKQVKIEYDIKVGNSSSTLSIGEKDGKLMVVNLAPQE